MSISIYFPLSFTFSIVDENIFNSLWLYIIHNLCFSHCSAHLNPRTKTNYQLAALTINLSGAFAKNKWQKDPSFSVENVCHGLPI